MATHSLNTATIPPKNHTPKRGLGSHLLWLVIAVIGAFAIGTLALHRGETISAIWLVVAAVCV